MDSSNISQHDIVTASLRLLSDIRVTAEQHGTQMDDHQIDMAKSDAGLALYALWVARPTVEKFADDLDYMLKGRLSDMHALIDAMEAGNVEQAVEWLLPASTWE